MEESDAKEPLRAEDIMSAALSLDCGEYNRADRIIDLLEDIAYYVKQLFRQD